MEKKRATQGELESQFPNEGHSSYTLTYGGEMAKGFVRVRRSRAAASGAIRIVAWDENGHAYTSTTRGVTGMCGTPPVSSRSGEISDMIWKRSEYYDIAAEG